MHKFLTIFVLVTGQLAGFAPGQAAEGGGDDGLSLQYVTRYFRYNNGNVVPQGGGATSIYLTGVGGRWPGAPSVAPPDSIPLGNIFNKFQTDVKFPDYHREWFHPLGEPLFYNMMISEAWARNTKATVKSEYLKEENGFQLAKLEHMRTWVVARTPKDYPRQCLMTVTSTITVDGGAPLVRHFSVPLVIPAHDIHSKWADVKPGSLMTMENNLPVETTFTGTYKEEVDVSIMPVEVAPEVLAVNSDFDEGRLDASTGYAIPDCFDTGDSLRAERNHLDGRFAKNEIITEDLHKGWFGVRPTAMGEDFWDGATVTITKKLRSDAKYGGNQEGQVRMHATWVDDANGGEIVSRAINPYDPDTLAPVNLVGLVYGSGTPIPSNATFWIEGTWGGKITLEWKYKKGDLELSHEQEFLVATQQTKQKWIEGIVYEIRLQSSDDVGGQVDITTFATSGFPSFFANREQLYEMYDYYPELFLQTYGVKAADRDEVMAWYGLARCTTAEIVGGLAVMEDAYITSFAATPTTVTDPVLGPFINYLVLHSRATLREIQQALYLGAWDIFEDLAWQGRAYRASGIYALEYVDGLGTPFRFDGWDNIDKGRRTGLISRIRTGVQTLADREQNIVVQPAFTVISSISVLPTWPATIHADQIFSIMAENPVPGGLSFVDFRGWALLKNVAVAADRWDWAIAPAGGIIPTWYTKTPVQHRDLDLEHIEVRGRDFHARKIWPGEDYLLESEWMNDRPTRPHTTRYVP